MSSYMSCTHCGLTVRLRAPYLLLERCPRCLARRGISVPMEVSERSSRTSPRPSPPAAKSRPKPRPSPRVSVIGVGQRPSETF